MSQSYHEWAEGHRQQGFAEGYAEGLAEALLIRVASWRFGTRTAKKLEALMPTMTEEGLARVADAVADSATADELLETATNRRNHEAAAPRDLR